MLPPKKQIVMETYLPLTGIASIVIPIACILLTLTVNWKHVITELKNEFKHHKAH